MEGSNRLAAVSPILKHYAVQPHFVEEYGRTRKIYSDKGVFALKKLKARHGTDFIRQVQSLYQRGYNRIVPIYPAADGRYAVLHDSELYYLMPWLANEEKENRFERHQQMFRELARLHTLSLKEVNVTSEERQEHYEKTMLAWEKETEFCEGFIEECERKQYMAPFELLFCLYYHDITQALKFSKGKLKDWHEKTKDDEKARTVIIHGKISTEHFLYDERGYGYFSNFEKSRQASPLHDLLPFLSRSLRSYPKRSDETVEWLYTYFKYMPFKQDEMLLFQSYLAHPGPVLREAETYHKNRGTANERKLVQQFQRQFWLLKNTEYIVMRIDEIERQKQQAQEAAKAQAEQEGAPDNSS
ncbi:spore coat protein YsxE [Bacillus infantis]|jgi:spore coat protein YsxE|uniref:spore coat protein YsxE n=1 Tax=Bacillus infantis TaxID=324767 RepID=UPI00101BF92B|nr:spore coat protein YsxE [Bacillus infantis]RYI31629.1 spore coat protein YsxE [Bacillus infantis]